MIRINLRRGKRKAFSFRILWGEKIDGADSSLYIYILDFNGAFIFNGYLITFSDREMKKSVICVIECGTTHGTSMNCNHS